MIGKQECWVTGALTKNNYTGMGDTQSIYSLVLVFGNNTGV